MPPDSCWSLARLRPNGYEFLRVRAFQLRRAAETCALQWGNTLGDMSRARVVRDGRPALVATADAKIAVALALAATPDKNDEPRQAATRPLQQRRSVHPLHGSAVLLTRALATTQASLLAQEDDGEALTVLVSASFGVDGDPSSSSWTPPRVIISRNLASGRHAAGPMPRTLPPLKRPPTFKPAAPRASARPSPRRALNAVNILSFLDGRRAYLLVRVIAEARSSGRRCYRERADGEPSSGPNLAVRGRLLRPLPGPQGRLHGIALLPLRWSPSSAPTPRWAAHAHTNRTAGDRRARRYGRCSVEFVEAPAEGQRCGDSGDGAARRRSRSPRRSI